eukprot:m.892187 g.892187  ORF g.892187 m.892187 type:complete len:182 (-) comp59971_c0_seq10:4369-4914(-)
MHWLVWWLAAASVAGVAWGALLVNIGPDAHCTVSIDGLQFLSTADICTFTSNSSACAAEGSLRLQNFSSTAGADVFGSFNKTSFVWIANGDTVFITAFRVYEDVSAVVFEQQWPNGCSRLPSNFLRFCSTFSLMRALTTCSCLSTCYVRSGWNTKRHASEWRYERSLLDFPFLQHQGHSSR